MKAKFNKFKIGDVVIFQHQDNYYTGSLTASAINGYGEKEFFVKPTDDHLVYNGFLTGFWATGAKLKFPPKPHKKSKKLRKVGDIMLDMEKLLFELHEGHDMQHGEVLYLINGWQKIHTPLQVEEYEDGSHPVLYGPKQKVEPKPEFKNGSMSLEEMVNLLRKLRNNSHSHSDLNILERIIESLSVV